MTAVQQVTRQAAVLLAPNPGPMTLDGTNTYLLREPGSPSAVVVDPGPDDDGHLRAIAAAGQVELILITHQHVDHTEGAPRLAAITGAPVRAALAEHCHGGGEVLRDGETIRGAGVRIDVIATPGHSADSVSFLLPADSAPDDPRGSVLTGDTVLGRGSTVIGIPDGTLAEYLDSMRRLIGLGDLRGLPAHGATVADLAIRCQSYLTHRLERLEQVRAVVRKLGVAPDPNSDETVAAVLAEVYGDIEPGVAFAAAYSVATQLAYLAAEG